MNIHGRPLTLREYPGVQWTPPHVLWGRGVLSKGWGIQFLTFIFYFLLEPVNSVRNEEKKILAKLLRRKKICRGRYRTLRWFYSNLHDFSLVTIIFRYFYYATKISVRNYKKKHLVENPCQKMSTGCYQGLNIILYYFFWNYWNYCKMAMMFKKI